MITSPRRIARHCLRPRRVANPTRLVQSQAEEYPAETNLEDTKLRKLDSEKYKPSLHTPVLVVASRPGYLPFLNVNKVPDFMHELLHSRQWDHKEVVRSFRSTFAIYPHSFIILQEKREYLSARKGLGYDIHSI